MSGHEAASALGSEKEIFEPLSKVNGEHVSTASISDETERKKMTKRHNTQNKKTCILLKSVISMLAKNKKKKERH